MCTFDDKQVSSNVNSTNKSFYLEMESILEEGSNKIMVSVHFDTIPTGVRDHYACHTFID